MENQQDSDSDLFEQHEILVDPGQSPLRIDKFLMDRLQNLSRNRIQTAIRAGAVQVNSVSVKPNYKVRPRDVIRMLVPRPETVGEAVIAEDIPLDIVHEDDDILIVNKAAGMVVHPGIGNRTGTLVSALTHYLRQTDLPVMEGNLADRPGLVHRIDKNTTGLMVIAKTEFAMSHLAKQFFDHSIRREYYALIWGAFDEPEGTITGHIGRHKKHRLKMDVYPEGDEGKEATTHYKVIEDLYYVSLVQCTLETGRTHQIRVHMSHTGHPVFNDERYGGDTIRKGTIFTKYKQFVGNCFELLPRQALHARTLGFIHPRSQQPVLFESDLPEDMQAVLDKWKSYLLHRKQHE